MHLIFLFFLALQFLSTHPLKSEENPAENNKSSRISDYPPEENLQIQDEEFNKAENDSTEEFKNTPKENKNSGDEAKHTPGDDKDTMNEAKPPPIGNFALPVSQQPAALFGFGGNVIEKGEVQLYLFADNLSGKRRTTIDLIPNVLFGITNELSIQFNFPFTPRIRDGHKRSSGLEDFFVQLEYAFYNKSTYNSTSQATVVMNVTTPTGSVKKDPITGFGSPSVFIGATYYHMWIDWFVFGAPGAVLTTSDHGTKIGDQFLYQFGIGRNIPSPLGWIYAWMVEVDGQYNRKNRIDRTLDHNSGGNVIFVTPSLWVSSKKFLLQFGVSFPINQNLFGRQNKFEYVLNLNCAWSFY